MFIKFIEISIKLTKIINIYCKSNDRIRYKGSKSELLWLIIYIGKLLSII